MSVTARAEAHHIQTYRDNVQMVAQQTKGHIRPTVTDISASGEAMSISDLLARVDAARVPATRLTNTNNPPLASRRWVSFPDAIHSGQYITKAEQLQRASDPTSVYVRAHTMAVMREIDDICMGTIKVGSSFEVNTGGILGAVQEGKTPGTTVSLPSQCFTAVGGAGLTIDKLLGAKERLNGDEFGLDDMDTMYCAISPIQVTDLLKLADGDGASLNAFEQQQLKEGKPTPLVGFTWIVTNRLPVDGNGDRMCPIWTKNNIVLALWQDVQGDMWNDTNANNTPYARVEAFVAAGRIEDLGVQVLACAES